jgi:hypothetical protein
MTIVNYNNLSNLIQLVKTYFYERQQDNYTFAFATKNDLQNTKKIKYNEANSQTIWVTCLPAQFWRFEIETDEDKKFEVSTGSGSMSDYWSSVLKIAEGMLVINAL